MKETILTSKQIIEIIDNIIKEENQKYQLDIKFSYCTVKSYFNQLSEENNLHLEKGINKYLKAFYLYDCARNTKSYYQNNKIVYIFNKDTLLSKKKDECIITSAVATAYHEYKHAIDRTIFLKWGDNPASINFTYDTFAMFIETTAKLCSEGDALYNNDHDGFMKEMKADEYALEKLIDFISDHPEYDYDINKIIDMKRTIHERYLNYNMQEKIDIYYIVYPQYKNYFDSQNAGTNNVFDIFYRDGHYRNLNDIVNHPNFKTLDKRIVNSIFSSKSFLKEVNINSLSNEAVVVLYNALREVLDLFERQLKETKTNFHKLQFYAYWLEKTGKTVMKVMDSVYFSVFSKITKRLNLPDEDFGLFNDCEKHVELMSNIKNQLEESKLKKSKE